MPRNSANSGRGRGLSTDFNVNHVDSNHRERKFDTELQRRSPKQPKKAVPTHFIAIPLNTNSAVLSRICTFQSALLETQTREQSMGKGVRKVRGLHSSIIIDPRRFHLTLGVMALEEEAKKVDGAEHWVNENDGNRRIRNMEGTKPPEAYPQIFAEDKPSWPSHVSPPTTISDEISTVISSTSPRISLNAQSQSHQGVNIPTAGDVSPSTQTMLPTGPIHSASNPTPTASTSLATSQISPAESLNKTRTVKSALELLRSLKPQLDAILDVPVSATELESTAGTTVMGIPDVEVEHDQEASVIGGEAPGMERKGRKSVLNVTLDKMDIMRKVAPPKPKAAIKEKSRQIVDQRMDPILSSPTSLGSATLSPVSSTRVVTKQENVDRFDTHGSASTTAECSYAYALEDGSASNLATPVTDSPCKLATPADESRDAWANVMYLAPREEGEEGRKLRQVCDLIHTCFKSEGYVTERRPLKLHCTVLNTSKRKPAKQRGSPFCYSDLLASDAVGSLMDNSGLTHGGGLLEERKERYGYDAAMLTKDSGVLNPYLGPPSAAEQPTNIHTHPNRCHVQSGAAPVRIDLGSDATVDVQEIGLWIMGSRGPNNEYISCGSVSLG